MICVSLEQYDDTLRAELLSHPGIDGIVLGDAYCQKRMFAHGEPDLIEWALALQHSGKEMFFQSPCYLTERSFGRCLELVCYLADRELCSKALVQDVGFAHKLHGARPGLQLIWSQLSATRNGAENLLFYEYLKGLGVSAVEVTRPEHLPYLQQLGLGALCAHKQVAYQTVNRECYYLHEHDIWDGDCGRACLTTRSRMVNEACGLDMRIDGYQLGRAYLPTGIQGSEDGTDMLYYARDWPSVLETLPARDEV